MKVDVQNRIRESIDVKSKIMNNDALCVKIYNSAELIYNSLRNSKKLILCGNGGSASDALHFAGEMVGRFQKERKAWPAIVLNADVATLTAISNDYGYDNVFERQAEAYTREGDIFLGISTSGNSKNVYQAMKKAKSLGATTIGLLGKDGGCISKISDCSIVIPSNVTARVQESHIMIIHIICEIIEEMFV